MKKRWGKGDPVSLSDLLKITPVANEIMQLSEELDISSMDVLWIVNQIIYNNDSHLPEEALEFVNNLQAEDISLDDDWDEFDIEQLEDEMDRALYTVSVKINTSGRFPEIGFKAGISDKEDINYFFDMVVDMLDKLE